MDFGNNIEQNAVFGEEKMSFLVGSIKEMEKSGKEVARVMESVENIAFQTNFERSH